MSAACESCGAPIVWALTTRGKRMPVDAEPHPEGNLILRDGVALVVAKVDRPYLQEGVELHRSHFATCPDAGEWRRK